MNEETKIRGGTVCCVPGCTSNSIKNKNVSFNQFPKDKKKFDIWIKRINRWVVYKALGKEILWTPARYDKVCGLHFNKNGKKRSVDHLPRFFPDRSYPLKAFQYQEPRDFKGVVNEITIEPSVEFQSKQNVNNAEMLHRNNDEAMQDMIIGDFTGTDQTPYSGSSEVLSFHSYCLPAKLHDEDQCESNKESFGLTSNIMAINEEMLHFYTGFQDNERFMIFINYIRRPYEKIRHNCSDRSHKLTFEEEALLVFSRLRLGLPEQDLAYRFKIHQTIVSKITTFWFDFLNIILESLNMWPSRNLVSKYMPPIFRETFPNTRIILDCTEIFIESPSDCHVKGETYSHSKSHCMAKGLVGIAPSGYVSFVSELHPGRDSDKEIFIKSDLPSLLEAGDSVIVDKGVLIREELNMLGVELIKPPFLMADCGQFSDEEFEKTQKIASLRVHVERVISEIKNYRILKCIFPNSTHNSINQIWKICCYLQNFRNDMFLNHNKLSSDPCKKKNRIE